MSVIQIGLVDTTKKLDPQLVQAVAAALNIQVTRDLTQFWNISATVVYLSDPQKAPSGVWPVRLVKSLPPGEGGFHLDKHNQPYAEVIATSASDGWTVAASHEVLEMLVDPYGNRLQSSRSIEIAGKKIQDGNGQFEYLVEACDPCEADKYAYPIQGVAVSDFLTPHFYDPMVTPGTRYSFTGALKAPRQILPGGYISWVNQEADQVQQLLFVDPTQPPTIQNLGPIPAGLSLRVWIDNKMAEKTGKASVRNAKSKPLSAAVLERHKTKRANLEKVAAARGKQFDSEARIHPTKRAG